MQDWPAPGSVDTHYPALLSNSIGLRYPIVECRRFGLNVVEHVSLGLISTARRGRRAGYGSGCDYKLKPEKAKSEGQRQ